MPGTAVIPVLPFALPQGHRTAPERGWKEKAGAGAGDKQLGQAHTLCICNSERMCLISPINPSREKPG